MEDVVERDIGDVGLAAGHPVEATDPWRARPDDLAHCGATWASGVEATSVVTACRMRGGLGDRTACRGELDGLHDLLVAGAPAQVAREALLDLGTGRVRDVVE